MVPDYDEAKRRREEREDRRRDAYARFTGIPQARVAQGLHRPDAPHTPPEEALEGIERALAELHSTLAAINAEIGQGSEANHA